METLTSSMEPASLDTIDRESDRVSQTNRPIEYSQPLEVQSSKLQRVWTKTIAGGPYKHYKKIAVLTLSFHPNFDDLGVGVQDEVNKLSALFKKSFRYPVKNVKLRPDEDAQVVINDEVARFVRKYHGLNHLLIVYYAGHGRPGENHGELVVFNKPRQISDPQMNERFWNQAVVWNRTESILRSAKSDVFVIFDCCHAGDLVYKRGLNRSFEYLGATGPGQVTELPGKASFTSALIHSLKTLQEEKGCFTSSELADRINNHHAFPDEQEPVLSDRDQNLFTGRIMLHALPKVGEVQDQPPALSEPPTKKLGGKVLTINFDFEGDPSETDIERLADYLNSKKLRCILSVSQIRWGGLRPSVISQMVERWKAVAHGRTLSNTVPLTPPRTALLITPGNHEFALHDLQSPMTPPSESSGRNDAPPRLHVPGKRTRASSSSSSSSGLRVSPRIKRRTQHYA